MWALYGYMKNLPNKNSTVDTFLDYSVAFYHQVGTPIEIQEMGSVLLTKLYCLILLLLQELLKHIRGYGLDPAADFDLPVDEYDAVMLIKRGFVYEFMRVALVKPLVSMQNAEKLGQWFKDRENVAVPDPAEIFKVKTIYEILELNS